MQRLTILGTYLSVFAVVAVTAVFSLVMFSGCAMQECSHLADCGGGQVCSAEGTCVADTRAELAGSNGADLVPRSGDINGDDEVTIGDVTAPGEAVWSGRIGPVGGFDGPASLSVWTDEAWDLTTINVTGESDEGFGLFILNLAGGLADLPVGSFNLTLDDVNSGSYAQLCSDSDSGMHFDGYPEETVVNVEPNDDGYIVDVKTTITNGFDGANDGGGAPTVLRVTFQLDHP